MRLSAQTGGNNAPMPNPHLFADADFFSLFPALTPPVILRAKRGADADADFDALCRSNPDWRIEQTAEGEIIVMPPTGGETGYRNLEILRQLGNWAIQNDDGRAFDSSTLFRLPNGAKRSPDAAWVRRERINALSDAQCRGPLPLCPDFLIELRSPTDDLADLAAKMDEYCANGLRLGWLIDPESRRVFVYGAETEVQTLENPTEISGDPVLPGFVLKMKNVFASLGGGD
jgi:Uma2 family endonuclease